MQEIEPMQQVDPSKNIIIDRRSFFGALLCLGTAAMGALLAVPILRYVLYPLYTKGSGTGWSDVGTVDEFTSSKDPVLKVITFKQQDGWREVVTSQSVYVSRSRDNKLIVLSAICPHLGCSVGWHPKQDKFICPCHGGEFKPNGLHILGPPPRAMDRLPTQMKDGKLQVHFEYFREDVPNQEKLS